VSEKCKWEAFRVQNHCVETLPKTGRRNIVSKKNSKKKKICSSALDSRSKKAFKITAHIKKSNAQTLQEVRSGIYA